MGQSARAWWAMASFGNLPDILWAMNGLPIFAKIYLLTGSFLARFLMSSSVIQRLLQRCRFEMGEHFLAIFGPALHLNQKRSLVSITFEKVAQDVICSAVDLRWMSIFWVFGPFLHLISAKMYILSQSLLLRVAVSFGGLCSATDLRWD